MMKFSQTHEWVRVEDQIAIIGISDYAQKELGEIVYVELPKIGHTVKAQDEVVVLESTKAAVDIYTPVSGKIIAINEKLHTHPETINQAAESEGWLFKIQLHKLEELDQLMSGKHYLSFTSGYS